MKLNCTVSKLRATLEDAEKMGFGEMKFTDFCKLLEAFSTPFVKQVIVPHGRRPRSVITKKLASMQVGEVRIFPAKTSKEKLKNSIKYLGYTAQEGKWARAGRVVKRLA